MSVSMGKSQTETRSVELCLEQGLHLRVCSLLVSIVTPFDGSVKISHQDRTADATSMFELLQLVALKGAVLEIEANGNDPTSVIDQIEEVLSGKREY
ncbi:MAG: HPr family phosphocarrier protein [Planctomycetaceae bacterium]|nr:HPr family phosphocarrier protein [Planctomycetaceae bacterium]MCB9950128.1 HPr family phosphocarrier protein [Planctomycetaceae bacterium]